MDIPSPIAGPTPRSLDQPNQTADDGPPPAPVPAPASLPSAAELDALGAELDEVDATLARLDRDPAAVEPEARTDTGAHER